MNKFFFQQCKLLLVLTVQVQVYLILQEQEKMQKKTFDHFSSGA